MERIAAFIRLARPLFLYGGFAGVALGAAVAAWSGYPLDVPTYLLVQALVTTLQLMVQFSNDYFDRATDVVCIPTRWSGGSGVLVRGEIPASVALTAALVCGALGLALAIRAAVTGNAAVAGIGIAILVLAWSYSAPPMRLSARGLGELDAVVVVAILVPCAAYAAFAGGVGAEMQQALIGPSLGMATMMISAELPDAGFDLLAGKLTLVARWGPSRTWVVLSVLAPTAATAADGQAFRVAGWAGVAALAPALAIALLLVRRTWRDPRPATIAFLGVALYATLVTGLAAAYALAAATTAR